MSQVLKLQILGPGENITEFDELFASAVSTICPDPPTTQANAFQPE